MSHTPGLLDDWTLYLGDNGFAIGAEVYGKSGVIVQRSPCRTPEDTAVIAHLLHAAPDLLAALKAFIGAEEEWVGDGLPEGADDPLGDVYRLAKVAVAKAEGA